MAFNLFNMTIDRGTFNAVTGANSPAIHRYLSTTDTLATILISGYFNDALPPVNRYQLTNQAGTLEIDDLIYVSAADQNAFIMVTAITPNVTTLAYPAAISNIIAAGTVLNGGGSATIVIAVPGVLATDFPFAQLQASTNPVSVEKVTPTADTITVLLSGDPGAATVLSYFDIR